MSTLKEGDKAPEIALYQYDREISLSGLTGKQVILYFYPKDDTPGCTAESCDLRDNYAMWQAKGFEVLGVSPDDEASHQKFAQKFSLPFPLIPDPEKRIIEAYGVWGEKNMYGKKSMGLKRTTFLIDENGFIQKIFKKVDTKAHTEQILKVVEK